MTHCAWGATSGFTSVSYLSKNKNHTGTVKLTTVVILARSHDPRVKVLR